MFWRTKTGRWEMLFIMFTALPSKVKYIHIYIACSHLSSTILSDLDHHFKCLLLQEMVINVEENEIQAAERKCAAVFATKFNLTTCIRACEVSCFEYESHPFQPHLTLACMGNEFSCFPRFSWEKHQTKTQLSLCIFKIITFLMNWSA